MRFRGHDGMIRLLSVLAVVLALAGCAASEVVVPDPAPLQSELEFTAPDGARLPMRVWMPPGAVRAVVLALHGFNDYAQAFQAPGEALAFHGFATYAYDQRGFGRAPERGLWAGEDRLVADLVAATGFLRRRHPGVPLYLLGESMGGAVAVLAAVRERRRLDADGLILSAPAVWGRQTMGWPERSALWLGNRLFPGLTLTGGGLRIQASDNIEMLRGLSRDPLVIKATRIDTLNGLVDLMGDALDAGPLVPLPVLYLYGGHDEIVPREPSLRMIETLPAEARARIAWYANGYHMLLRDLDAAVVLGDIAAWIADPKAPLPSGADRYARLVLAAAANAKYGGARAEPPPSSEAGKNLQADRLGLQ